MDNIQEIINRFIDATGVKSERELSEFIDMQPSDFSKRKKKKSATLFAIIIQKANTKKINLNWLINGEGDPYLKKEPPGEEKPSSKKIIFERQDMVTRFKNPDRAREMTRDLLEIEEISEELVEKIASNIKASLEAARTVSGLPKKTMND